LEFHSLKVPVAAQVVVLAAEPVVVLARVPAELPPVVPVPAEPRVVLLGGLVLGVGPVPLAVQVQVQVQAPVALRHLARQPANRDRADKGGCVSKPHAAGDNLPLTQEFLAQMMGVRRTSVTGVATELQSSGMISYSRGHIHIKDLEQIRQTACECDADVRSHYRRMFHSNEADASG
jgi:hypothetical protein